MKERRKATGIQTPIGIFGVALGAILPPLIIDYADSTSFIIQAGVMIIVGFMIFFISIPGYREDQVTIDRYLDKHKDVDERVPFFKSLKIALKQQPFLIFIITYTLYRTLVISIQASVPFVVEFVLAEEEEFQTFLSGGFLIGALISSPIWAMLANKTNNNRKIMLITSTLLTIFTFPLFFLNSAIPMVIAVIIWGFGLGGFWTMIAPVLADVIDESIVKTHRREEGIYNGFQQFFGRLAVLLQALSFSVIQTLTNFKEGQPLEAQPHSAIIGIQVHFALIPAYVMLIGTLIFWNWYKLSPDRVTENQLKVIELGL